MREMNTLGVLSIDLREWEMIIRHSLVHIRGAINGLRWEI